MVIDYDDIEDLVNSVVKCVGGENMDSHGDSGCIEIRNVVVFYASLKRAKRDECICVYRFSSIINELV
jgi:hypothetical protein